MRIDYLNADQSLAGGDAVRRRAPSIGSGAEFPLPARPRRARGGPGGENNPSRLVGWGRLRSHDPNEVRFYVAKSHVTA